MPPTPRILGHRGAAGSRPENTLLAFEEGARHVPYLETDAWLTRDGHVVLHHDATLLRSCGQDVAVGDLDLVDLQALDAGRSYSPDGGESFPWMNKGVYVPTLKEALERLPQNFFNIEIKDPHPGAVEATLEVIRALGALDRVLLAAEKDPIMAEIRKRAPDFPTSACRGEVLEFLHWLMNGGQVPFQTQARAFQIPHRWEERDLGSPALIEAAHGLGVEVHYWTVNDPSRAQELLNAGADGIVTDHPQEMVDLRRPGGA